MSLILVVDPDSRHAAHVASMARKHLKAEFVTADSGFRALEVLADRVPDVVLTAPLLPTRDEAVLSDHLRALGDAGAHVQTLTIPILSPASAPPRGVRGRFKRGRPAASTGGCDPEFFAQQVHQYLQRAQQSRRVNDDEPELEVAEDVGRPGTAECLTIEADPAPFGEDIDLTPMLAELVDADAPDLRAPVNPPARVIEAEVVEADPPDPPRALDRSTASGLTVPAQHLITLPAMVGDAGTPSTVNVAIAVSVQVGTQIVRRVDSAEPHSARGGSAKPLQDEWGFFDPDQCGFRALLARLDAIAETEEEE